jgi:DNA-binding transcriptional ArsR family regulator
MSNIGQLASVGQLIGEPSRAAMLIALLDGRALTAGELASVAGITPQTASGHLAALLQARLLMVATQGRHRYYQLATAEVAELLERMLGVAVLRGLQSELRPVRTGPRDSALRRARTCYDHMAGGVAVAVLDSLVDRGYGQCSRDGATITPGGMAFFEGLGVRPPAGVDTADGAALCRPCMDWSERRFHLAGEVGRNLLQAFLDNHWVRPQAGSRVLVVTHAGSAMLDHHFGITLSDGDTAP